MRRRPLRLLTRGAAAVVVAVALAGCQGLAGVTLPGGAATGPHVYHVTVQFQDVLDLVPQSAVKVDDVTVGSVESIALHGWSATVRLRIEDSVRLPANAEATIEQTSLLGEKYVALAPPTGAPASGRLVDGSVVPLARSGRNPEVEEVLGALSLLLNGGGVAQLKTITVELDKALKGHETDVRGLVTHLRTVIGNLDAHKADIVRALAGVDRLAATLAAQRQTIATALDTVPAGTKALADEIPTLTTALQRLSTLGGVATRVVVASKADTVADLRSLQPVLSQLSAAGAALPASLQLLLTYPFPDSVMNAVRGDYTNLAITADLNLADLYRNLLSGGGTPGVPKLPAPTLPVPKPSLPIPLPTLSLPIPLPTVTLPSLPIGCPTTLLPGVELPIGCPTPSPTPSAGGGGLLCPPVCLGSAAYETDAEARLAALLTGSYA